MSFQELSCEMVTSWKFNYSDLVNIEHSVCAFCSEDPLFCVYAKHVSSMILH